MVMKKWSIVPVLVIMRRHCRGAPVGATVSLARVAAVLGLILGLTLVSFPAGSVEARDGISHLA